MCIRDRLPADQTGLPAGRRADELSAPGTQSDRDPARTCNRLGDNAAMCFIELVDYNENMLKDTAAKKARCV